MLGQETRYPWRPPYVANLDHRTKTVSLGCGLIRSDPGFPVPKIFGLLDIEGHKDSFSHTVTQWWED